MPPCIGPLREIPVVVMDAKISEAVVYRDGVRVTRKGKAKLSKGAQKIRIEGITDQAREDSFRVSGKGAATLSSIDVRRTSRVYQPKEDTEKLYQELKKLKAEADNVTDEMETQNSRLKQIEAVQTHFSQTFGMVYAADEASLESLVEMDETSTKMEEEVRSRLRELDEESQKLRDKIDVVQSNINRIESERRTETTIAVEVSLEVSKASSVELLVTYQTTGAGWQPSYDIDLHSEKAKLRRIAQVFNRTREDWSKVRLTVSTATARPAEAIEATPYYLSAYEPQIERDKSIGRFGGMKASARPEAMPAEAAPPPAPMMDIEEEFAQASETVSGIAVYEIPKTVNIPSDNEQHPITLTEEELESETVHHWYPDGMAEVIAQDVVTNGSNVILPGSAKVYAESDYIGESSLPLVSPREEFKLGARIANDVKGEKRLVERELEKAGVLKGKLKRSYKYRLEVSNYAKKDITIEIFDRIPHSLSTQIEVKSDLEQLGIEKEELGVLEWHRNIAPNGKETIEYGYVVVWDKDVTVSPSLP
jgi:uncharacterized protein (TIGR02231 family)